MNDKERKQFEMAMNVLDCLAAAALTPDQLVRESGATPDVVRSLKERDIIEDVPGIVARSSPLQLTDRGHEMKRMLDAVEARVTG